MRDIKEWERDGTFEFLRIMGIIVYPLALPEDK